MERQRAAFVRKIAAAVNVGTIREYGSVTDSQHHRSLKGWMRDAALRMVLVFIHGKRTIQNKFGTPQSVVIMKCRAMTGRPRNQQCREVMAIGI